MDSRVRGSDSYVIYVIPANAGIHLESITRLEQLAEKDKQISELHQLLMTAERRSQLLIEYPNHSGADSLEKTGSRRKIDRGELLGYWRN